MLTRRDNHKKHDTQNPTAHTIISITDLLPPNVSEKAFPTHKQLDKEESAVTRTN